MRELDMILAQTDVYGETLRRRDSLAREFGSECPAVVDGWPVIDARVAFLKHPEKMELQLVKSVHALFDFVKAHRSKIVESEIRWHPLNVWNEWPTTLEANTGSLVAAASALREAFEFLLEILEDYPTRYDDLARRVYDEWDSVMGRSFAHRLGARVNDDDFFEEFETLVIDYFTGAWVFKANKNA